MTSLLITSIKNSFAFACVTVSLFARWEILGIDLMGPFPVTSEGNRYVCTVTDLFTKWVFARAVPSKSAASVADVLLQLVYSYGPPRKMISDQGREFVNQVCMYRVLCHAARCIYILQSTL